MSSSGAAFFDLDRTLLAGASGVVFSAAMKEAGLVSRAIPGEALAYRLFNTIGETLPSMALARQGDRSAAVTASSWPDAGAIEPVAIGSLRD